MEVVSSATVAQKKKVRFAIDTMAPFLVSSPPRGQSSATASALPRRPPHTTTHQDNDIAFEAPTRSARDPRRLTYSQSDEPMYTPREQSPRSWEEFAARERAAHRAAYYESPTSRQHVRRGTDGMDAEPMQPNTALNGGNLTQQVTLESLAVMMSQLMIQLNELTLRMGGTDQLIARYDQVLATHQESLDRIHQEFSTYTRQSNPPTRATSVRTFSTAASEEQDRSAVVVFSMDGRHIADDEFFTQMLSYMGMQPGQATYTPLAGGKGLKIQFNTIGEAVAVLKKRREIAQKAQARVDEDLPLRQLRQKNRPVFRYLLEVLAREDTWYMMRGGRIQYNNTFLQMEDMHGAKILERRGTWQAFNVEEFLKDTGAQVETWWKEKVNGRTPQNAPTPTERNTQERFVPERPAPERPAPELSTQEA